MFLKPHSLASLNAASVSSAVCFLPMFLSTSSFMVCGFMLILEAPIRFITSSFSLVTVSGLPASTVYSAALCTGKFSATADIISSSCLSVTEVGVPPPI